ncbi:hypothetical protein ACIQFZ_42530, partial [Streptomyces sp. NPDC093064]|uniref:hypothetical protein n=1 Tax=Streptomyces sp. NPDC093064 TaxID=3366020 RepID=UPI0038116E1F
RPSSTRPTTTWNPQNHRSQPQSEISTEPGAVHTPHKTAFDGTLDQFVALYTDFRTGVGPWTLPGKPPNSLSFRFTWKFSPSAPNSAQSVTTNEVTFTWEARESK